MGKNNNGGKKQKSQKNGTKQTTMKLEEITPDNIETFAGCITKSLGDKRFVVLLLEENMEITAKLAGSVRARVDVQDYVMVQKAGDLGGCNAYILYKYNPDEASVLKLKVVVDGTTDNNDEFEFDDI